MKIRKVNLAIASALMMAGSAAAIAPASAATTPEEFGREVARNFSAHWQEGYEWCINAFGEEQHDRCMYHTMVNLNHYVYLGKGPAFKETAERYEKLANDALIELNEIAGDEEIGTPFD